MESSDGVEPEIDFSTVKKRRYEKYSSERWCSVTKVKVLMSLGGDCTRFMSCGRSL